MHKIIIRPVAVNASETWCMLRKDEQKSYMREESIEPKMETGGLRARNNKIIYWCN